MASWIIQVRILYQAVVYERGVPAENFVQNLKCVEHSDFRSSFKSG